ncbi:putative transcription factor c2h2 cys6 protein [Botrytis fragariae]|uniref:Putative transcription factor c2h2 cys6 protein n=1 Tax=Botrytis fragariae TaxID=1964551 RepID=A0A8H6B443_9HELO|nr:putative transcription factor c2h2 cys6 protein [Botrytis fragariae]KAF5879083.1 putative transcription factor c2h2 cys6 protein [Botrytis fragariae]
MTQTSPTAFVTPQARDALSPTRTQPIAKRIKCKESGCGKLFSRKEHLTRHMKLHDPNLQYECPVCGRRYARSDVLKRHLDHHAQNSSAKRTMVACTSCHERKLKCDDASPCRSCTHTSTECSRSIDGGTNRTEVNGVGVNEAIVGNSVVNAHSSNQHSDLSHPWFQSENPTLSLPPYSDATLELLFQSEDIPSGDFSWGQHQSAGGNPTDFFHIPLSDDASISLHALNDPHKSRVNVTYYDADPSDRTRSTFASQSPLSSLSSEHSEQDHLSELRRTLSQDQGHLNQLLEVYFTKIHPSWPILHAPTFNPQSVSPILLGSMLMLANWLDGSQQHEKLASIVFEAILAALLEVHLSLDKEIDQSSLQNLQGLLLCVTTRGMSSRAVYLNGALISTCRHAGIFNGQNTYYELATRLSFSSLRVDAYLSVLMDYPPSVRYQEISIPLPKSTKLWTVATDEERRKLQWYEPAGREKARFCFLMRDLIDASENQSVSYHLTDNDYHLGLCSLQIGTWETAREAFCCCDSDELITDSKRSDPVHRWGSQLNLWRTRMEDHAQLHPEINSTESNDDRIFPQLNLILWHISALTVHAPLKLLQRQGCCFKCRPGAGLTTQRTRARLSSWMFSPHPRTALWNAGQICRLAETKFSNRSSNTDPLLNPLAMPGILKSAIAVCSYAYHIRACFGCTSVLGDSIDLFNASHKDDKLKNWTEHGIGMATWGTEAIPVCHCRFKDLESWFRERFARHPGADTQFTSFLAGLGE